MLQQQSSVQAFVECFWMLGILFLAVIPLTFLMQTSRPHPNPLAME
jgi:hypothetical protein